MIKPFVNILLIACAALLSSDADAQNRILQLGYEDEAGSPVTGFFYRAAETQDDAPIALLMHGLGGSTLHWLATDNRSYGDRLANMLVERGYRVAALDARSHGARPQGAGPMERVIAAREGNTAAYEAMITETLTDYQQLIDRMHEEAGGTTDVLVVGYSMGAQMATLLAARDERVTHIVTLVPPAVENVPALAPINAAPRIKRPWLLLTSSDDPFASDQQNAELEAAGGEFVTRIGFNGGHALPASYVSVVENWLHQQRP